MYGNPLHSDSAKTVAPKRPRPISPRNSVALWEIFCTYIIIYYVIILYSVFTYFLILIYKFILCIFIIIYQISFGNISKI